MTFTAIKPIDNTPYGSPIHEHSFEEVESMIIAADRAAHQLASLSPSKHAELIRAIASCIEEERSALVESACAETALPEGRIGGEITRTTVQFELFAQLVETGTHLGVVIDKADPGYSPAPRPDLRKMNRPLGVVAIFAASNFPLAFSVAGGDAASAIAAGNAVIAKAHPAHPNTCAIVEGAVKKALKQCSLSPDLYSIAQSRDPQLTHWLVDHPLIQAVGFTGSEAVGRILIDRAAKRNTPIPVYAEMGSLNPLFITQSALDERYEALARGVVDSALMGSGQFCTKPGLIFLPPHENFITEVKSYLGTLSVAPLLSSSIAERFSHSMSEISKVQGVEILAGVSTDSGFGVTPTFIVTTWEIAQAHPSILEEHFGPTTVIITTKEETFCKIAQSLEGQLTATIQGTDTDDSSDLITDLSKISGRVIWNGFPTGVAVTSAMNHGGPWPASSSHTTSVGIDAIYRFMRPVAYQGIPQDKLPEPLKDSNPWHVHQKVNG
jgi:NADP-dependent aldehyde dehydrogenase